jgi:transcriptional regulator with XRE-family HTH domain
MNDSLAETFGQRLFNAREALGLSQKKVAERVGIATNHYGRLERGNRLPSGEIVVGLCQTLSLSADFLLGLVGAVDASVGAPSLASQAEVQYEQMSPELRRSLSRLSPESRAHLQDLIASIERDLRPRKTPAKRKSGRPRKR